MTAFDFTPLLPAGLPPAAVRWTGLAKYNFTGGNNDADQVPVDGLIAAATASLKREGRNLATYNLATGRRATGRCASSSSTKLKRDAGIACTRRRHPDGVRARCRRSISSTARCSRAATP